MTTLVPPSDRNALTYATIVGTWAERAMVELTGDAADEAREVAAFAAAIRATMVQRMATMAP